MPRRPNTSPAGVCAIVIVTSFGSGQLTKSQAGQACSDRPSISLGSSVCPHSGQYRAISLVYSPALDLLYFEDLPLGGEWLSRRRTLTETDLALYRGLAGDLNPLHSDREHAERSPIGLSLPGPLLGAVALG